MKLSNRAQIIPILFAGLLSACAHDTGPPAAVVTQEVKVPVPVACDPKVSARPDWPDTREALRAADAALKLQLLYAGRKGRDGYIGELEAAVAACRKGGGS